MPIFGKRARDYVGFARTGMILILLMGVVRFAVGLSGVPYERATHLVSLSILTLVLFVVYGYKVAASGFGTYRHLLPTAFALAASMYGFIVLAILTEGLTGLHGYFHVHSLMVASQNLPPEMRGLITPLMNVPVHIGGQLLAMVVVTFLGWGLASLGFLLSSYLGFLRNAVLLLAGFTVARLVVGASQFMPGVGTWITSLTLVAMILSVCYGYSAPSRGFDRYRTVFAIGLILAVVMRLFVISGTVIATSLMIPGYFHPHTAGVHLLSSLVGIVPMTILAGIGFVVGKRSKSAR